MSETLTRSQKVALRGVWGGFCNNPECLAPNPTWLHRDLRSYYCDECARVLRGVPATAELMIEPAGNGKLPVERKP